MVYKFRVRVRLRVRGCLSAFSARGYKQVGAPRREPCKYLNISLVLSSRSFDVLTVYHTHHFRNFRV